MLSVFYTINVNVSLPEIVISADTTAYNVQSRAN